MVRAKAGFYTTLPIWQVPNPPQRRHHKKAGNHAGCWPESSWQFAATADSDWRNAMQKGSDNYCLLGYLLAVQRRHSRNSAGEDKLNLHTLKAICAKGATSQWSSSALRNTKREIPKIPTALYICGNCPARLLHNTVHLADAQLAVCGTTTKCKTP